MCISRWLLFLLFCISCSYQAPIAIQPNKAQSLLLVESFTANEISSHVLDTDKTDADYFDEILGEITFSKNIPSNSDVPIQKTIVDYLYYEDLIKNKAPVIQDARKSLYKIYSEIDLFSLENDTDRLALLINAYHFFIMEGVVLNFKSGNLKSLADIGGTNSLLIFSDFKFKLGFETINLNTLIRDYILPYAGEKTGSTLLSLSNSTLSSPSLSREAYRGEILFEQIESSVILALALPGILKINPDKSWELAWFFQEFREEFEVEEGSLEEYLLKFKPDLVPSSEIKFLNPNWKLDEI